MRLTPQKPFAVFLTECVVSGHLYTFSFLAHKLEVPSALNLFALE